MILLDILRLILLNQPMRVSSYVGLRGSLIHEYNGQIDFSVSDKGERWQVSTLVDMEKALTFSKGMAEYHLFDKYSMDEHVLRSVDKALMTFRPRKTLNEAGRTKARRALLKFLTKVKLRVIWKEGHHGYQIDRSGRIFRKWRLNNVWTVPERDNES